MTASTTLSWHRLLVIVSAGLVAAAVVAPASSASAAPTRYEAEASPASCDGTIDSNWSGYSGAGFCNTYNALGSAAQFTVNASAVGTATVAVRFAHGTTTGRPADVVVNGTRALSTSFEGTGSWSTWATKTVTVSVRSGSNTIRFSATSSNGLPNVDYVDVEVGDSQPPPPPPSDGPVGWASVDALGQNGTTGGAGGPTVTVSTTEELLDAIDTVGRLIIRVQGTISITSKQGVRPHKTIVGVGTSGVINGGGLDFYRSYNVIVRNITFTNAEDDAINVGQESHHVWIDHNEFVGAVDGAVDVVRQADYVTVSWNWFRGTDKSMLIGHSDGASTDAGHLKVTIHHNYFDGSRQRHPRIRFGEPVHVFNNYYRGNELYGIASTENAGALVEGNYFDNVPFPCHSASGYADSGPGRLVERNNIFVNSGRCETAGNVAEPGRSYQYTVDRPADVPAIVRAGAGPQ